MKSKRHFGWTVAAIVATLTAGRAADAHFVWIQSRIVDGKTVVDVGFGEPGGFDKKLVERVKQSKVYSIESKTATPMPVELNAVDGCYRGMAVGKPSAIVATCEYGVVQRGDAPAFKLAYFAKRMLGSPPSWSTQSACDMLPIEALPTSTADGTKLLVIVDGKPLAAAEVTWHGPKTEGAVVKANADGIALVPNEGPGEYGIYVGHTSHEAGEHNGKKFSSIKRYATLSYALPGTPAIAGGHAVEPRAAKLFAAARSNRNVWDAKFPGFACDLMVNVNGQVGKGSLVVDSHGVVKVDLKGLDDKQMKSVKATLDSMASHRMASSGAPEDDPEVGFGAEAGKDHPQGTLLVMTDDKFHSSYRVRNNQIWVVNRQMGPNKMTISMLENQSTSDGRYLPAVYCVSMWDAKGALASSSTIRDEWTTLGGYSLPKSSRSVSVGKSKWDVTTYEYSNHKLLTATLGN